MTLPSGIALSAEDLSAQSTARVLGKGYKQYLVSIGKTALKRHTERELSKPRTDPFAVAGQKPTT